MVEKATEDRIRREGSRRRMTTKIIRKIRAVMVTIKDKDGFIFLNFLTLIIHHPENQIRGQVLFDRFQPFLDLVGYLKCIFPFFLSEPGA